MTKLAWVLLFVLSLVGGAARAQQAFDAVTLHDGSLLQGHVSEIKPGVQITLVLLDGQARTIAWADIAESRGPSFANPAPPPPPQMPVQAGYEAYLQPGPGRVPLQIESVGPQMQVGVPEATGTGWVGNHVVSITLSRRLCDAPCTLYVPSGASFPITTSGPGLRTATTDVDVPAGGASVRMRAPTLAKAFGAVVLLAVGAVGIGSGGALVAVGQRHQEIDHNSFKLVDAPNQGEIDGGGAMIGIGIPALAGGIALLALNRSGVESSQPLGRVSLSVAPARDGVAAQATLRF
jgi:hypothetical protein